MKRWKLLGAGKGTYLQGEVNIHRGTHGGLLIESRYNSPAEESFQFSVPRGSSAERKLLKLLGVEEEPTDVDS